MIVSNIQKKKATKVAIAQGSPAPEKTAHEIGVSQDRIRERAFQIYESRGSRPGHDIQDWLRAEHQILER